MNRLRSSILLAIRIFLLTATSSLHAETTVFFDAGSPIFSVQGCLLTVRGTFIHATDDLRLSKGDEVTFTNFGSPAYLACSKKKGVIKPPALTVEQGARMEAKVTKAPPNAPSTIPDYVLLEQTLKHVRPAPKKQLSTLQPQH